MAQTFKLSLNQRKAGKSVRREMTDDQILGVVYGGGIESTPVFGDRRTVTKVLEGAGTSHIIQLELEKQNLNVLLKDADYDPVTGFLRHFDLHAVRKGEKIVVEVPIELVGAAPGAKLGLIINQILDSLEVRTDPANIPDKFEVDVSTLASVGDTIIVSDLELGGVEVDEDLLSQPIVKVDEVQEHEIETEPASVEDVESEHGGEADEDEGDEGESGDSSEKTE